MADLFVPEDLMASELFYSVAEIGREASVADVKKCKVGKLIDNSARSLRAQGFEGVDVVDVAQHLERLVYSGHLEWVEAQDGKQRYVRVTDESIRQIFVPGLLYGCTPKEAATAPEWLRKAAGIPEETQ